MIWSRGSDGRTLRAISILDIVVWGVEGGVRLNAKFGGLGNLPLPRVLEGVAGGVKSSSEMLGILMIAMVRAFLCCDGKGWW